MREDLNCEIVKDLLPNYIEGLTSEYTNEAMESHFEACESCKKAYELLSVNGTENENLQKKNIDEVKELKYYMKKVRLRNLFLGVIIACLVLGGSYLLYDNLVNICNYNEPSENVEVTELYQLNDNYVYFNLRSKSEYLISAMTFGPGKIDKGYVGTEIHFLRPVIGKKLSKVSEEEKELNLEASFVIDIENKKLIDVGSFIRTNDNITVEKIINYAKNKTTEKNNIDIVNSDSKVYYIGRNDDDKLLIWEEGMELPKYPN
ncbi:MAG: zf-HC2 domain-containing protein [Clostridium sp.]|nr:zf-HC2 domain-containing protein [Clostridium sp.]